MWVFPIPADRVLEHNRPDITVIDKKINKCLLIDPACPFETRIEGKEEEKGTNYSEMKYEIARIWKRRKVEVIPVVIGALRTVTKHFEKWIEKLNLGLTIEPLQKACLLGTARIRRKEIIRHFYHVIASDLRVREIKLIMMMIIIIIIIIMMMMMMMMLSR